MQTRENLIQQLFQIKNDKDFDELAMAVFRLQSVQNPIYKKYLKVLKTDPFNISKIIDIPFLPIEFFKNHKVILENLKPEITFSSSGTTGVVPSLHHIADLAVYEQSFLNAFEAFWGDIKHYCVLALLPSYLERKGSSLIYMADRLIKESGHPQSGFFLNNLDELVSIIKELGDQKILLLGVSYALLDLAENYTIDHPDIIVMETGGMKGRRREMVRDELHSILKKGLNIKKVSSEYGMTELLSQAYSYGDGIFSCPPWMKILIRDANDPLTILDDGQSGGINIIDLANINSCSFIMTQDLGKKYKDGSFEILGRFDSSDIRGCNLLLQ